MQEKQIDQDQRAIKTDPELLRLLEQAAKRPMTEAEIELQRQSWVRGMTARCEHGELDYEQCPECRSGADRAIERLSRSIESDHAYMSDAEWEADTIARMRRQQEQQRNQHGTS